MSRYEHATEGEHDCFVMMCPGFYEDIRAGTMLPPHWFEQATVAPYQGPSAGAVDVRYRIGAAP